MRLIEVFDSIQGEGSWIGIPCTFIRFAGCSLHCPWCDTKESWSHSGALNLSVDEVVKMATHNRVVITGGEPTEQADDLKQLIHALKSQGKSVSVESNGTYEHYDELGADWIVVSPKPSAMYAVFPAGVNELKYVVTEDFNVDVAIPEAIRTRLAGHIWLQPCDYQDYDRTAAMAQKAYQIAMKDSRLRVGIQLHKIYCVK